MSKVTALYHIVFATKRRLPALKDSFRGDFHNLVCTIVKEQKCHVRCINSVTDHVHMLIELSPSLSLSSLMAAVKARTSGWLKKEPQATLFDGWGDGYYGCTVSPSQTAAVTTYIMNQPEHHRIAFFDSEIKTMSQNWGLNFHPADLS